MVLPSFLIIGAARSGTTTIYSWLQEHPDIYLPLERRPEPHFFLKSEEFNRGFSYYSERYFSNWNGEKAIGEKSTSYLYQATKVAPRIKESLPEVKLIALLRNPIDRAYSNYWFTVLSGLETLSFEDSLLCENERRANPGSPLLEEVQPYAYIDRGHYLTQIKQYLEYFPRDQLHISLFDELIENPTQLYRSITKFLQVDETIIPSSFDLITNSASMDKQPMSLETRQKLVDLYRSGVMELGEFLNVDLFHWIDDGRTSSSVLS